MKIITICGSMKYKKQMMEVAQLQALEGNCIFTPIYQTIKDITPNSVQLELLKQEHLKKIELSDTIIVINKDNYIGEFTKIELEHAKKLGKEIIYYTDLIDIKQIKRIIKYEKLFNEISLNINDDIDDKVKLLERYYKSKNWKKDFEDEEKGLIPNIISKGILSEDGIYNLLDNYYNKE